LADILAVLFNQEKKMKAVWNDKVIAESENTIIVEGNHYFPRNAIKDEFFEESETNTYCGWKGSANYFTVSVDGVENPDSAWYYPTTSHAAKEIEGYVAFWRGVDIIK